MDAAVNGVAAILEATNSFYAIIALFMLGMFALLWKFGFVLIEALRENTRVTKESHAIATEANDTAKEISESIVTNHGSKNIGDSIDRLTTIVWAIQDRLDEHIASSKK